MTKVYVLDHDVVFTSGFEWIPQSGFGEDDLTDWFERERAVWQGESAKVRVVALDVPVPYEGVTAYLEANQPLIDKAEPLFEWKADGYENALANFNHADLFGGA